MESILKPEKNYETLRFKVDQWFKSFRFQIPHSVRQEGSFYNPEIFFPTVTKYRVK